MEAARQALRGWHATGQIPKTIEVRPVDEAPATLWREDLARQRFTDTWSMFPPEFEVRNVQQMIRWQAWTAKPAVR